MPAQSPVPQANPAGPVPMSRRERRGRRNERGPIAGKKLPARGTQNTPPARKHNNYRRG